MTYQNKEDECCDLHILFDNTLCIENIKQFLNNLNVAIRGSEKKANNLNLNDDYTSGVVDFDKLINTLNDNSLGIKNRYLIGFLSRGKGNARTSTMYETIAQKSHFLIHSTDKVANIEEDRKFWAEKGKPLLQSSDAHKLDDIGTKFTWIKADPTFEGLKQILFEHEERVRIQEINPAFDFDKPYFKSLSFNENEQIFTDDADLIFDKSSKTLPLNPNLVAIIGGRGEGKSMLTEYIATSFEGKKTNKEGTFKKNANINISYCKTILSKTDEILTFALGKEKHSIPFIYINQGNLKNIVENREQKTKLADSICTLAKINKVNFDEQLNQEILNNIKEVHNLNLFLDKEDNKIDYLEKQEESKNKFITNITTEQNKEKLNKYSENLSKQNELKSKKEQLEKLKKHILDITEKINKEIQTLNDGSSKIPLIEDLSLPFKQQIESIDSWLSEIVTNLTEIDTEINRIKSEFSEYKGDLTTLLQDVNKFQQELFDIRNSIKQTKETQAKRENLQKRIFISEDNRESLITEIKKEYERQKSAILSDWEKFSNIEGRDDLNTQQKEIMSDLLNDLTIEVVIDFDEKSFYNDIKQCINGTYYRNKNNDNVLRDYFNISDINSFFTFIENNYLDSYEESFFYENVTEIFFDEKWRQKFIKVYPILKYQGKDLNKISVGQKGTVYLKMMLATEAFSKPIIFDQPEDDLDNEFIVNNLIDLFKKLKKYRQVIIVTHNANLVVNADAEQVIVARNDKGKLSYISGALENPEINKQICKILEGGEQAFLNREKKYGFKK